MLDKIQGIDVDKELDQINLDMIGMMKVKKFGGKDGLEIKMMKEFEETCAVIRDNTSKEPKEMTVFEFYSTLDYVKKKNKPKGGRKSNIHKRHIQ